MSGTRTEATLPIECVWLQCWKNSVIWNVTWSNEDYTSRNPKPVSDYQTKQDQNWLPFHLPPFQVFLLGEKTDIFSSLQGIQMNCFWYPSIFSVASIWCDVFLMILFICSWGITVKMSKPALVLGLDLKILLLIFIFILSDDHPSIEL